MDASILLQFVLLIVGFVFLIKGSDLFVDGASSIASILKIPTIIVGLTIVALGTSAPEAAVSITSSIAGNNALAVSNVIGSNLFNLLMVIGVAALLSDLLMEKSVLDKDLPSKFHVHSLFQLTSFLTYITNGSRFRCESGSRFVLRRITASPHSHSCNAM